MPAKQPPLVVDLDGTLLRSDLLLESALAFVRSSPLQSLRPLWPFLVIVGIWHFLLGDPSEGAVVCLRLLAAVALIGGLVELPLEAWSTFRIEQRFGFNRMTWKLYALDTVKGVLVGAAIGLPLAALVLWIMGAAGTLWWLWAWGAWVGFMLAMMVIFPRSLSLPLIRTLPNPPMMGCSRLPAPGLLPVV